LNQFGRAIDLVRRLPRYRAFNSVSYPLERAETAGNFGSRSALVADSIGFAMEPMEPAREEGMWIALFSIAVAAAIALSVAAVMMQQVGQGDVLRG
jgi:hypothetical protein